MANKSIDRTGEIHKTNSGELAEIIKFNGIKDVTAKFLSNGAVVKCEYHNLKRGTVRNPLTPKVHGVGYVGIGKWKVSKKRKEIS